MVGTSELVVLRVSTNEVLMVSSTSTKGKY
jgi:hypothetical protein